MDDGGHHAKICKSPHSEMDESDTTTAVYLAAKLAPACF